jgi:hypothetical protein
MARRETAFLRDKMLPDLRKQGFKAENISDAFVSGRPDFRIGRKDLGQLDVEFKIIDAVNGTVQSGLTKLQKIEIREMNKHGMPAICLTMLWSFDPWRYIIHHEREIDLDSDDLYVIDRPSPPGIIDGKKLMELGLYYLEEHDIG